MTQIATMNSVDVHKGNITDIENQTDEIGKEEQKAKFILLRAKGFSFAKIVKQLKVSKGTLSNWNHELQEQITQAKAMELEALQEEYFLLKEGRIRLLGDQLKAIQEEIGNRDLSKVSTDRLMELQLRYFGELKGEYVEIAPSDKIGTKLNSEDIAQQLQAVLARYKAGQINESQAKLEQTILQSMLKAIEQTELEAKFEKLEAVLKSRRWPMAHRMKKATINRLLAKGLTGWEAGKLVLQDLIDSYHKSDSVLTEADMELIRHAPMKAADVRDYNMFMALCRGFHVGYMTGEWTCSDACLQITYFDRALRDAAKRRTVELFESFGPRVVTRKQYEGIVAAQRENKLEFEYSLGYVIEERFYAIAPSDVKKEIDEAGVDIESVADFVAAVPEAYSDLCKQAIDEIRHLYTSGELPAVCHKKDMKKAEPLLAKWKKGRLSAQDTMKLVDMLYITGQQLYDCAKIPEWKAFVDEYQRHWFDDERFRHVYAVLEDCPEVWVDEQGCYKGPAKPSEWITRSTELLLGLVSQGRKAKKSVERVGAKLRDRLDTAEQNIRLFLAVKAILDAVVDAIELDVPGDDGVLAGPNARLGAYIGLYNVRLEELNEERKSWESAENPA